VQVLSMDMCSTLILMACSFCRAANARPGAPLLARLLALLYMEQQLP
jgi:hypothetical protein